VVVDVPANSPILNKTIVDLNLPEQKILIVAIERAGQVIMPRGSTVFGPNDKVSVMADDDYLADFVEMLWVSKDQQSNDAKLH
jgi:Trk K+ transport system NAD-binding subunit